MNKPGVVESLRLVLGIRLPYNYRPRLIRFLLRKPDPNYVSQEEEAKYVDDVKFTEFLAAEADDKILYASSDELADWAFGGMRKAIDAYEESRREG